MRNQLQGWWKLRINKITKLCTGHEYCSSNVESGLAIPCNKVK